MPLKKERRWHHLGDLQKPGNRGRNNTSGPASVFLILPKSQARTVLAVLRFGFCSHLLLSSCSNRFESPVGAIGLECRLKRSEFYFV